MTNLPYRVEVKSDRPCFETIAAFDCEQPASRYAADCEGGNRQGWSYRVRRGKKVIAVYGPEED